MFTQNQMHMKAGEFLMATLSLAICFPAFAQFDPISKMTKQIDILNFCSTFKSRPQNDRCIRAGQERLDSLRRSPPKEVTRNMPGGTQEATRNVPVGAQKECSPRSRTEHCLNLQKTQREALEAQHAQEAAERRRMVDERQREMQVASEARKAKEAERISALKACEQTKESKLYKLASVIWNGRQTIEMAEHTIDEEQARGRRAGVVDKERLYQAMKLIDESKAWIELATPEYKALGGRERDIKSLSAKNPCES